MKPFEANQPYHLVLLKICCNPLRISLQNLSNMMLTLPLIVHLSDFLNLLLSVIITAVLVRSMVLVWSFQLWLGWSDFVGLVWLFGPSKGSSLSLKSMVDSLKRYWSSRSSSFSLRSTNSSGALSKKFWSAKMLQQFSSDLFCSTNFDNFLLYSAGKVERWASRNKSHFIWKRFLDQTR